LDLLTGPDALCPVAAVDAFLVRSGQFCLLRGPSNIPLLESWLPAPWTRVWAEWGATSQAAWTLVWVYAAALVFFAAGCLPRLAPGVCWGLQASLHTRLVWVMNGGDCIGRMALFYLIFSRCGAVWSLDHLWQRRRHTGPGRPILVPVWPVRLMQ